MKLFHPGLRELLNINQYLTHHKIGFLTIEVPLPKWVQSISQQIPNYTLALFIRRECRHVIMGLQSLKLKEIDSIYVIEIYNQHLLFLLPLLKLTGKKIFLGLHGNQTLAQESQIKALGFRLLKSYLAVSPEAKAVLLELDDDFIEPQYQLPKKSKVVIPHPMISEVMPRFAKGERLSQTDKVKIGMVGMIRSDKPIKKILIKIVDYAKKHPNCEIVIGMPKKQIPKFIKELGIRILDTTKEKDYFEVLRNLDILVTYFDKDRYFYRASGVISDAGSCGCYIIAPDYPLIKHQITWPTSIGETFSNVEEIDTVLDKGISQVRELGQDNHWEWRKKRNAEYIAKCLFPDVADNSKEE
ncbi:MAG: hypothetical protein AB4041_21505 [Microcystaceae cyanobacterium]